ncbi:MAG: tetratricopeptide repeat protein [Candidatus Melainabacteria bacterium]|nr:tetratricopeptide repeat protein [Candidatus Melainabacteria bacterium]
MNKHFLRTLISTVVVASSLTLNASRAISAETPAGGQPSEETINSGGPVHDTGHASGAAAHATGAAGHSDVRTTYGDKWAVVVGLDSYSDPSLNTVLPLDDSAKRVSEALEKKGFAKDHVRLLLNRDATKQSILSSISSGWLGKLSRKSDLVVVFVATQCFPASDGKVYLIPYDARLLNFFTSTITVDDIVQAVKSKVEAKDVVVVFQTSFSGTPEMMAGCKAMFGRYNISVHHNDLPDNFTVLCSSKPGQPTWGTYFSDNFAEDLSLNSKHDSLGELFNKIRNDTVYDTAKDCAGCKVQSPVLISKRNVHSIALGSQPDNPVTKLPEDIALYLRGESVYTRTQALLDEYRASRSRHEGWTDTSIFRQIETGHSTTTLSEEFRTKVDNTILMVKDYLKENPNYASGHYLLGRLLQFKQDHNGALEQYKEAMRLSPDSTSYHAWVARAMEENGQDAKGVWQKAYDLNSKSRSALDALVKNAVVEKDYSRASTLLNQALALYPGDATLHVRISDVLKQQGQLKLAVEQAQEAVFLDEHSIEALVNLGNLLIANKDERAAHAAFREALELDSKQADYNFVLAQALEKTNDPEGAMQAWTRFVEGSDKDDKRLDDAKKRLDELKKASE